MEYSKALQALEKLASRKLSVTLIGLISLAYVGSDPAWIAWVVMTFIITQGAVDLVSRR